MTALLPCECGREPTILRRRPLVGGLFRVFATRIECTPCEQSTQAWHDTEELAIAAWNRRAPSPAVVGLVKALERIGASGNGGTTGDGHAMCRELAWKVLAAYRKEIGG